MGTPRTSRRPHPEFAARLFERRLELGISSLEGAAELCGISEAAYASAENGTAFTQPRTLNKIAKGFGLEVNKLRDLRDGRAVSGSILSVEDQALADAVKRLRAMPTDVRQSVIGLVNGLADAFDDRQS